MIHKDPIYIISFPKTGRTWLVFTLAKYFHKLLCVEEKFTFLNFSKTFFAIGRMERPDKYNEFPHLIFEHGGPEKIPDGCKGGIIIRNVLDTMVSWYFHLGGSKLTKIKDKEYALFELAEKELIGIAAHMHYMIKEARRRGFFIAHYQHLGELEMYVNLLSYMGYPVDEKLLQKTIEESAFSEMYKFEELNPMNADGYSDKEGHRVRRGKVGGYVDYLSVEEIAELKSKCMQNLSIGQVSCLEEFKLFRF